MKAATVIQLKKELAQQTQAELIELCLSLSKFKKEIKSSSPTCYMKLIMKLVISKV